MSAGDLPEEGGEGYFASVSDLMVGILFIFLLMLTVFALNLRDDQDAQSVAREKYEAALKETEIERARNDVLRGHLRRAVQLMRDEVEGRRAARDRLLRRLGERLQREGLEVKIVPESGVLRLPEQLLFDVGQSELGMVNRRGLDPARLQDARARLARLAAALAETVPCFAAATAPPQCDPRDAATLEGVLVEGHSDRQGFSIGGRVSTPQQAMDRNDQLSTQRALAVFKELREQSGVDGLRNGGGQPLFAVSGYGDRRPAVAGDDEEAFRQNRRIDLRFLLSTRTSGALQRVIDEIAPALGSTP